MYVRLYNMGRQALAASWAVVILSLGFVKEAAGCGAGAATPLVAYPDVVNRLTSFNYPKPYPNNFEECWRLEASLVDYRIILETTDFQVEMEQSKSCSEADYVDVRDGDSDTSPLLRRLCGILHMNITSSGTQMFIKFRSDVSISWVGFMMRYWAVPTESVTLPPITSRDGCKETSRLTAFEAIKSDLVSPNYPHNYEPSLDKCWQLESLDRDQVILLEVLESHVEEAYSCQSGDYVEARDGTDPSDKLLERWCGDTYPRQVLSTGPTLLLRFHTDQTDSNFSGFRIRFSTMEPPVSPAPDEGLDPSTHILIGTGVVLILMALLMAAIAYHKKVLHANARIETEGHRRHSHQHRNQSIIEDDRVRLAFEAILRRPGHRDARLSTSMAANLQAPPPYEPPGRPPSHLGFIAPHQPGYSPWMVQPRHRDHRRHRSKRRRHSVAEYPPGTPLPPDPPPYEELIKEIEQREWILGPVLDGGAGIMTVSEGVSHEGAIPGPVYSLIPEAIDMDARGTPGSVQTIPGYIMEDSPEPADLESSGEDSDLSKGHTSGLTDLSQSSKDDKS